MKPAARIIDLTRPIEPGMSVYPGDPPVEAETVAALQREGYYMRRICFGEHTGTHIDAPAHFIPGGLYVDELPLEKLIAPATAVDLAGEGPIAPGEIEARTRVSRGWWLLLRLHGRVLAPETARLLVERGIAGLGVDAPSPDDPPYMAHKILLGNGVPILENLVIPDEIIGRSFTLIVAPLPIARGSGSPARVYALLDTIITPQPGTRNHGR